MMYATTSKTVFRVFRAPAIKKFPRIHRAVLGEINMVSILPANRAFIRLL